MQTIAPSINKIRPKWFLINAKNKILGRLATKVSLYLLGKNNNEYVSYYNMKNYIIIINTDKIKVTGNKLYDKIYYRHSGYVGNLKKQSLKDKLLKNPKQVLFLAIKNMLPKNKLSSKIIKNLKLFIGNIHPYKNEKINYLL